ncbi:MAG: NUDIX hydrolase [Chloroflexia bacterium]
MQANEAEPVWLGWARRLQVIAQNGLTYVQDLYDRERYEQIAELAAEILSAGADLDLASARGLFGAEIGHATPKVDVRGAVFRDGEILLVRERADGCWTLPGGWADPGESPGQATVREVYEESGYRTRAVRLLALYDRSLHAQGPHPFHIYKAFFHCEVAGEEPDRSRSRQTSPSHQETDGVGFFRPDALPQMSLGRVTPAQIARLLELYRNPAWPTDFD